MGTDNVVLTKSFDFALTVIKLYKDLVAKKEFVLSRQILRSGTSIGANVEEAQGAQTRKDFHSKMTIAYKEARETHYWLRLLKESGLGSADCSKCLKDVEELSRILASITRTTKSSR